MNSTQQLTISVPIAQSDRNKAKQFAQQQSNSEKAKQVYYNTLAVLVTNNYLQMLDVQTSLQQSHSWNAVARVSTNIADLNLPGKGHLECRPILESDNDNCYFPQDKWHNPMGYVVVKLDESCKQGTLLGFLPQVNRNTINIKRLQSLDDLFIALHSNEKVVQLSQWLENIIDEGWRNVEEIIGMQKANSLFVFADIPEDTNSEKTKAAIAQLYACQQEITKVDSDSEKALIHLIKNTHNEEIRWKATELLWEINPKNPAGGIRKAIDLGMHFGKHLIALMVAILPKPDGTMAILVRLYPLDNKNYLPPRLELSGLDLDGNSFFTVQARSKDNYIQFKFTAELGDRFNIRVALNDTNITEGFVI